MNAGKPKFKIIVALGLGAFILGLVLFICFRGEQKEQLVSRENSDQIVSKKKMNIEARNESKSVHTQATIVKDLLDSSSKVTTEAAPICSSIIFRQKQAAKGNDDFTEHRNAIEFSFENISKNQICLRIDDVPVAFERQKNSLIFGPVAGPKSTVTVQYCSNSKTCPLKCVVPKDSFAESIGAAEEEKEGRAPAAKWDPSDREEDLDAVAAVDRELQEEVSVVHELPIFKDWITVSQQSTCNLQ